MQKRYASDFFPEDSTPTDDYPGVAVYLASDVDAQIEYLGETLRGVMMSEDALKAHIARQDAKIAELKALLRRVVEWNPALPAESSLIDEIHSSLMVREPTQR